MRTKGHGESALLLLDAIEILERKGVRYAVIGAMAASVHGVVRASMDADAVVSLPSHDLIELKQAFRAAGFAAELRRGDTEDPIGAVRRARLTTNGAADRFFLRIFFGFFQRVYA